MVTDLHEGAFQPNFAKKMTESDQSSDACQSFRINVKAVKQICHCMNFPKKLFIFGRACQILGRDKWKIWARGRNIPFFLDF